MDNSDSPKRREFIKRCVIGTSAAALGLYTLDDLVLGGGARGLRPGLGQDPPAPGWKWAREARWYQTVRRQNTSEHHCLLCPHRCILAEGDRGLCRTRAVSGGKLLTLAYGNPCSVHLDPVEKKPLFHFLPGTGILSLATAGCNLRCLNCQNWEISQFRPEDTVNTDLSPERVIAAARENSARSIAYTYSEPIVFYEYTLDTSVLARESGLRNVLVTAGYIQPEPLRELCQVTSAANVNIKSFTDGFYQRVCQATLAPVLRAVEIMREENVWVEITHLAVPTLSDDLEDVRQLARWIVKTLGPDVPLHCTRFYPAYRLPGLPPTPVQTLERIRDTALDEGLRYVYLGNVPGSAGQDTICPGCRSVVIRRLGYQVISNTLQQGCCPCGQQIAGIWA